MTEESPKRITIPTLKTQLTDGSNFPRWRREANVYLRLLKIQDVLSAPRPPAEPISEEEKSIENSRTLWSQADDLAMALLTHNCDEGALEIVLDAESAQQAWTDLINQYEGKQRTNLWALFSEVMRQKYNDREMTVEEHIKEFSTKWSRLTAQVSGETDISKAVGVLALFTKCDEMKAITLLESFPDYYKVVINNIATQQENLSFSHVSSQVRTLITKRPNEAKKENTSSTPAAFSAQQKFCTYCRNKKKVVRKRPYRSRVLYKETRNRTTISNDSRRT
jgi:hypothetical protein